MAETSLNIEQHVKYWRRCLTSFLPNSYTSTDSTRMTLGFFILAALDLLGQGAESLPQEERENIHAWILKCQHPSGGFCGSPNHKYPEAYYTDVGYGRRQLDPPNLAATFFALMSLSFVGGFEQVRRYDCLQWLRTLQREDGSFGQLITENGNIEGGKDMRNSYVAAAVRWILRGDDGPDDIEDIDVDKLVDFLRAGETYDGGISESSEHEAHAGYTYCAIAALSLLSRLPQDTEAHQSPSLTDVPGTIRWLVSRQTAYEPEPEEDESEDEAQNDGDNVSNRDDGNPDLHPDFVGFNGRCNKVVDTCYAFWVGGSLDILGQDVPRLVDTNAIRRFLCEQTQHRIGGFGKYPDNPPDIYHSYLGLAALSIIKERGLKPLDAALCVSTSQRDKINYLREDALLSAESSLKYDHILK